MRMKQIILLALFLSLGLGLQAQISFAPEAPSSSDNTSSNKVQVDIDITNDLAENQAIFWYIDRETPVNGEDLIPSEWEFQVCDKNTCYISGLESCPTTAPVNFTANETFTFNIYVNPHGTAGTGNFWFHMTDENGAILASAPVNYDISGVSSTDDIAARKMQIYPNPTSDYIQITNDNEVSKVAIYNIVGKNIKTSIHFAGKSHDVSTLQKGMYLVRIFDENEKVLSVFRMNKN